MKKISVIAKTLREQVEEGKARDPFSFPNYKRDLRGGITALIPILKEDPTLAALAIHGLTKVVDEKPILAVVGRDRVWKGDWEKIKPVVRATEEAREVISKLEEARLEAVIVAAVVANHILKQGEPQTEERTEEDGQESNARSYSEA